MDTKKLLEKNDILRNFTQCMIKDIGITRAAEITGVDVATLSNFANDKINPRIEKVVEIYEALRCRELGIDNEIR